MNGRTVCVALGALFVIPLAEDAQRIGMMHGTGDA